MSLTLRTVCLEFGECSDWEPGLRHYIMCVITFLWKQWNSFTARYLSDNL